MTLGKHPDKEVQAYAERMKAAPAEQVSANIRNYERLKNSPAWDKLDESTQKGLIAKAQELYSLTPGDGMYGADGVQDQSGAV